jgi:hypothetical protein
MILLFVLDERKEEINNQFLLLSISFYIKSKPYSFFLCIHVIKMQQQQTWTRGIQTSQDARAYMDWVVKRGDRIRNSNLYNFLIPIVEKRLYLSKNFSGLQKYLLEKAFEIGF